MAGLLLVTHSVYIPHSTQSVLRPVPALLHVLPGWARFPITSLFLSMQRSPPPKQLPPKTQLGGPCRLQEQPRDAWGGGGSQGFVLFSHITSLGNNAVKLRGFVGMGDAEAALSGWRRALRKEGVWSKELLFDKENLKFLIKRLLFWEESSPEQEGALQRLKHPGNTIQAKTF